MSKILAVVKLKPAKETVISKNPLGFHQSKLLATTEKAPSGWHAGSLVKGPVNIQVTGGGEADRENQKNQQEHQWRR